MYMVIQNWTTYDQKILSSTVVKGEAGVINLKMKQRIIQLHLDDLSERKIARQTKKQEIQFVKILSNFNRVDMTLYQIIQ